MTRTFSSFLFFVVLLGLVVLGLLKVVPQTVIQGLWAESSHQVTMNSISWDNITPEQIRLNSDVTNYGLILVSIQVSEHALEGHPEAQEIEDCANRGGFYQTWKSLYSKGTYYGICKLGDDKFGIAAFQDNLKNNKTAFIPGDGKLNTVLKYLSRIATKFLKGIPES